MTGEKPVAIFMCSRGRKKRPECSAPACGRPSPYLCDYPVTRKGAAGTCDRPMCATHRNHVGPERDYCPAHAVVEAKKQGELDV